MTTSIIKALAGLCGMDRRQVAAALGLGSTQAVSNKYTRDSWSAADVNKVARYAGYKLAIVDNDGRAVLTFPAPDAEQPAQQ